MLTTVAQTSSLFTAPLIAAAAVAAIAIPVIIHLLWRVRRQRQVWAAMRFLQVAIKKQKNKLRLEHLLLLLTRCLILLLLGLGLAGPVGTGLSKLFGQRSGQRLVHLILDDTLTSGAQLRVGANHLRLDDLKKQAIALLDQVGEKDHVSIWRSAQSAMPLLPPSQLNKPQALQLIDSIKPRHTASDMRTVLATIQSQLDDAAYLGYEQTIVILSDFSHGSLGKQTQQSFDRLARDATVCLIPPAPSIPNMQITKVQPRRSQMLRPLDGALAVMLDVTLARQGKIDQAATCRIGLYLDGKEVSTREHQWAAGQSQATVQMDLSWNDSVTAYPFILPIEARLASEAQHNRLHADDRQFTQVQIREQLRILLVDDAVSSSTDAKGFTASQWLSFALSPAQNSLNVQQVTAAQLSADMLVNVDVCMVLRPDQISKPQMASIDQWTRKGGMLWLFAPADEQMAGLPVWALNLSQQLDLPVKLDVKQLEGDWGLNLASRPPAALSLLGADWQALLRPVRVSQMLGLFAPLDSDSPTQAWLSLNDPAQTPVMVSQPLDDGYVLASALALSPDWSNLQTRPLFVPLLHEAIASLTSQSASRQLLAFKPGTIPQLGERFTQSSQLIGPKRMTLKRDSSGKMVSTLPIDEPGVYRAQQDGSKNLLLINVNADDASLAMSDEHAVKQLLFDHNGADASHAKLHWLDRDNPTWPTVDSTANSQLGWNLLWIALALMILETMLARWFSHASTQQRSWAGWLWRGVLKLLHVDHGPPQRFGKGGSR